MNRSTLVACVLLALVACDRGGGARPAESTIVAQVKITRENAAAAARASFDAAIDVLTVAHVCAAFVTVPPPTTPPTTPPTVSPPAITQTVSGVEGGSAQFSFFDNDASGRYTTGDSFSVDFQDYAESGLLLSGAVLLDELVVIGDPLDNFYWTVDLQLTFVNLSVASSAGGGAETFGGTLRCRRESRISVTLLKMELERDFAYRGSRLLAGTEMQWHDIRYDLTTHWFFDGAVDQPDLGGVLLFTTEQPLSSYSFFSLPFLGPGLGGVLEVSGSDGTRLEVVPGTDFTSVRIDVFLDDDPTADDTIETNWFEFTGDQ
jgi:hypothetical protein